MRYKARVDSNQREIVEVLRQQGCSVLPLHQIGKGCPDLLVGYEGKNFLLEVKDGNKPPSQQKLTPDEQKFHQEWQGEVATVDSPESAIALVFGLNYLSQRENRKANCHQHWDERERRRKS